MAHLHVSTAQRSAPLDRPADVRGEATASRRVDDLWVSDLHDDPTCLGLELPVGAERGGRDELRVLSLTSDVTTEPGMAARTWHDEVGL